MDSLRERTDEWTEDMEERESVLVNETEDDEEEVEQMQKEAES